MVGGQPVKQQDPRSLGFTFPVDPATTLTSPVIAVSGLTALGPALFSQRVCNFYQVVENVALSSGRHNVKVGADLRHTRIHSLFPSLSFGAFNFSGQVTGSPLGDLVLGKPFFFLQAGGKADKSLRQTAYYFYAQDDFRLRSNLTLNIGVRYELAPGFTEQDNLLLTFKPGAQSKLSPALPAGLLRPGDPDIPHTLFPTGKKNFAPRLGLAWDPTGSGKMSIRASYGLFYDESALVQEFTVQQPPDFQFIAQPLFPPSFADPLAGNSPFKSPIKFPLPILPGFTVTWTAPDLKLALIQHWNLTLQRQITASLAAEVAYVGNKGSRLQGTLDPNQAIWSPGATSRNIASRRPFPLIGTVTQITSAFDSNYHGLQATLTQRLSQRSSFQASYAWSKAIDNDSTPISFFIIPGQARFSQNSRDLATERGRSAFDVHHRFVVSYLYELPFFNQRQTVISYLLGGWRLSGITAFQSGLPFTVIDSADPSLDPTPGDRTNLLRDPNLPGDKRSPQRWFDTAAFQRFVAPSFGNAGRNTSRPMGS